MPPQTQKTCPDCEALLRPNSASCACGWQNSVGDDGYRAKLAAIRRNPDKTPILIGGQTVWVDACRWKTGERRCRMAESVMDFCSWHAATVRDPAWASDRAEFDRWLKSTGRWEGSPDLLWRKVQGY